MFLANIALVGQIYHLSSRPPNAILLWLGGIIALPWILRSKGSTHPVALRLRTLDRAGTQSTDSLLFFDGEARQFVFYAMLGWYSRGLACFWPGRVCGFRPGDGEVWLAHPAHRLISADAWFVLTARQGRPGAWTLCGIVTVLAGRTPALRRLCIFRARPERAVALGLDSGAKQACSLWRGWG